MTTYLMNHIPDYMDDRIKLDVVLSDNVTYQIRSLANSNEVSSWYDPEQHRAFTTIDINEVPEQFRNRLIQHSTSTGSSTLMYPRPTYNIMSVDTGTIVHFNQNPYFTGQSFCVWWDSKNKPDEYEVFSANDPISDHPHEYGNYGKYVVAFSTNVTRLNMNKMLAAQFELQQGNHTIVLPYFSISSLTLQLNQIPYFEGDELSIKWNPQTVKVYTHSSQLSDYQYTYDAYGEKNAIYMNSSGGYVSVDVLQMFPDERGLAFIESIKSRNNNHVAINNLAFSRTLKQIDCAKIESIATQWYDCYELTSIRLPQLTSINVTYAVNCMPNLKSIYAPRLKKITNATSTFKGNTGIEKLSFPSLTSITGQYATFAMNASLSSAYFPSMVSCSNQCFDYCVNLVDVDFSSLLSTSSNMFRDCISLAEIRLPKVKYIASSTFYRCQNLKTIDLREVPEAPALASTNAFNGMPSDYKILVSQTLESQFKAATNWKSTSIVNHITT